MKFEMPLDDKYVIYYDNGIMRATRNGEEWRDLTGDNLILALVHRCADLEQVIGELKENK